MGFERITNDSIREIKEKRPKSNAELTEENRRLREEIDTLKNQYDKALIELAELYAGGGDDG